MGSTMIVQPASTNPRGPVRRGLRALGLAMPVVLLAAVVVAGLSGPRTEAPTAAGSPEPEPPAAIASTAVPASPVPASPVPDGPPVAFPGVTANLAVRSVTEAHLELAAATGNPLAVAGWLTSLRMDVACATAAGDPRGALSPLCERTARLLGADPTASSASAHLHLRFPPGVRLPPSLEWPGAQQVLPVPVVLVGRSEDPASDCVGSTRGCAEWFIVDRVTWASGEAFDPGPIFDTGLEAPPTASAYRYRDDAEGLVTGWSGTVLVSAVVHPGTVAALDPDAGAALARLPVPDGLVWYVRGLETTYGPARYPPGDYPARVRWVVVDETTGNPLATGITGEATAAVEEDPGGATGGAGVAPNGRG
jgi:hypothetical protein